MDLDLVLALANEGALVKQGRLVSVETVALVFHILALAILYLLADLLSNRGNEFRSKAQISYDNVSEVLRRVLRVVDVPLKLVIDDHIPNSTVD